MLYLIPFGWMTGWCLERGEAQILKNNLPCYLPTSFDAERLPNRAEVHESNFELDTGYVCWELCGFLYSLQANFRVVFLLSHDFLLPNPYPVQYSPLILPLDHVSSDIRTAPQNKPQNTQTYIHVWPYICVRVFFCNYNSTHRSKNQSVIGQGIRIYQVMFTYPSLTSKITRITEKNQSPTFLSPYTDYLRRGPHRKHHVQ
jgi:hypothetical protein